MGPRTEPDPNILARVSVAFIDLMRRVDRSMRPAQRKRFRTEVERSWLPRESQAFEASMAAAAMVANVASAHNADKRRRGTGIVTDQQFAVTLLLEYIALSEGILKQQLRLVAFLAAQTGLPLLTAKRSKVVASMAELEGPDVALETLVENARLCGFGKALDGIFDNRIRRSIAHFDVSIDLEGNVRFFETRRGGVRIALGEASIEDLQAMNWRIRDFCHAFSAALADFAARELGRGSGR